MAVSASETVMDGVGQQRNRSGHSDDRGLGQRGQAEQHEAELDCADALGARLQCSIHRVGGVVAVRPERLAQESPQATGIVVLVLRMTAHGADFLDRARPVVPAFSGVPTCAW